MIYEFSHGSYGFGLRHDYCLTLGYPVGFHLVSTVSDHQTIERHADIISNSANQRKTDLSVYHSSLRPRMWLSSIHHSTSLRFGHEISKNKVTNAHTHKTGRLASVRHVEQTLCLPEIVIFALVSSLCMSFSLSSFKFVSEDVRGCNAGQRHGVE